MSNKSNLNIEFDLDENQIPEKIIWESISGSEKIKHEARQLSFPFGIKAITMP